MNTTDIDTATTISTTPPVREGKHRSTALLRRAGRALTVLLAVLAIVAAAGAGFQAYASSRDDARHPAPGALVEVDGHAIHLQVTGSHVDGQPTVILESAMGPAFSSAWGHIQQQVSRYSRVVSYDRPGLGWSEAHPHGQDPVALAHDLRAALEELDVAGPYLLVAHSLGAFHARVFAASFPDEVVGMVLVDPSHEDQWDRLPQSVLDAQEPYNRVLRTMPVLARFGVTRMLDPFGPLVDELPDEVGDAAGSRLHRPGHLATTWDERRQFDEMGDVARRLADDLGDLPIRYISSGQEPEMPDIVEARMQLHREQAATISTDTEVTVIDAGHVELVSQAGPARQVADVIEDLWQTLAR